MSSSGTGNPSDENDAEEDCPAGLTVREDLTASEDGADCQGENAEAVSGDEVRS